jgi:hypothetical protein
VKRCRIHIAGQVLGDVEGPAEDGWSWAFTWLSPEGPRTILLCLPPGNDPGIAAIVSTVALQRYLS